MCVLMSIQSSCREESEGPRQSGVPLQPNSGHRREPVVRSLMARPGASLPTIDRLLLSGVGISMNARTESLMV